MNCCSLPTFPESAQHFMITMIQFHLYYGFKIKVIDIVKNYKLHILTKHRLIMAEIHRTRNKDRRGDVENQ